MCSPYFRPSCLVSYCNSCLTLNFPVQGLTRASFALCQPEREPIAPPTAKPTFAEFQPARMDSSKLFPSSAAHPAPTVNPVAPLTTLLVTMSCNIGP